MWMSGLQGKAGWVILLLLALHLHRTHNQHVRKKREILPNQPRIITQDGHLVFQSGTNHNITFKAGNGGGFLLNNIDLVAAVNQAEITRRKVNDLSSSFNSAHTNITTHLQKLEKKAHQTETTHNARYRNLRKQANLAKTTVDEISSSLKSTRTLVTSRLDSLERNTKQTQRTNIDKFQRLSDTIGNLNKKVQSAEDKANDKEVKALRKRVEVLEKTLDRIDSLLKKDECRSNPCLNGATCVDNLDGYTCLCPKNYKGPRCTQDVDECQVYNGKPEGCQHGAKCINTPGSFRCECTSNYHGVLCSTKRDHCESTSDSDSELCGHGYCLPKKGPSKYFCHCEQGWTTGSSDPSCTKDIDECTSGTAACSKNPSVTCVNTLGSYKCGKCPRGYSGNGFVCEDIDECQNGVCGSQVECTNTIGSYTCHSCPSGYRLDGKLCKPFDSCTINNGGCHAKAICIQNGNGVPYCSCNAGYVGSGKGTTGCVLRSQAAACSSSPCKNHGTCEPHGSSAFSCKCAPGFRGPTCEVVLNACDSQPCQNGGSCSPSSRGTFTCTCSSAYTGGTCEESKPECAGNENAESGSLEYPTLTEVYPDSANCIWTIKTRSDKVLELTFQDFNVQCNSDSLHIYDGPSTQADQFGKYCGTSLPNGGSINSTTNTITLWFKSDASGGAKGFNFSWTSHTPSCGESYTGSSGSIKLPKNYGGQDCSWTVAVELGKVIVFVFGHMDLNCNKPTDFVEIRDGETPDSRHLGKYCNDNVGQKSIETSGPYGYVRFHRGSSRKDSMFVLTYHTKKGCGHTQYGNKGILQSRTRYTERKVCVWVIETAPNTQVKLHFVQFDLNSTAGSEQVFLVVRDGKNQTATSLGTFSGKDSIRPLVARTNFMLIEFHTDDTMTGSGFKVRWELGCGGYFPGMHGEITSPGWPNNYPVNVTCFYKIVVPDLHTVVLDITNFDLKNNVRCRADHLKFYDGEDETAVVIKPVLCGPLPTRIVRSSGESMTVEFQSGLQSKHQGFRATFTAKNASGDPNCGGQIAYNGGEGGIVTRDPGADTMPDTVCNWFIEVTPGYVIHLTFTEFHFPTYTNGICGTAGLTVFDVTTKGKLTEYHSFGTYCGTDPAVIHTLLSTDHTMRLTMKARNNSIAEQYFKASYTVLNSSSGCGGKLTSASGVITSKGYPRSIPHNIHCVWIISVPQGHQIRLKIADMDMRGNLKHCKYNKLEIRNGGTSTASLINRFCGERLYYPPIISHSNRLHLKFATDEEPQGKGFKITYDSGATGCGGDMSTPHGGFTSPNYPGEYYHNVDCIWTISVPRGNNITLTFDTFRLQRHKTCMFDFLELRENSQHGKSLGKYCGKEIPGPFSFFTRKLWIRYKTDYKRGDKGFQARYTTNCNVNIGGHSGVIESPNYLNSYPQFANCTWVITVPKGNKIHIIFATFQLIKQHEKLEVRDGPSAQDKLLQTLSGSDLPKDIHSSGKSLRLHFDSDGKNAEEGFRIEWVTDGCGGLVKGTSGTLSSPGYPNSYPTNLQCDWTIEVPLDKKVKLTINSFDLQMSGSCSEDALEFYAGSDATGHRISQMCHQHNEHQIGQVITTEGNTMFVRFISDNSTTGKGFKLTYMAGEGGCGGLFSALHANIFSPKYPNEVDDNLDCRWEIQVEEGHTVELSFNDFSLQGNYFDQVSLYDGLSIDSPRIARLSGHRDKSGAVYKSDSNKMLVRLVTDDSKHGKGFNATYRTACGGTLNADKEGSIRSPATGTQLLTCTWHINSKSHTKRVSLTFTSFNIQGKHEENYVSLADGRDRSVTESKEVQHSYSGQRLPPAHTSRSSSLTVTLNVSALGNAHFRAVYTSAVDACGGNFTAPAALFNSPQYPDMYPANIECIWQITATPGNTLQLTFKQFRLAGSIHDDYVEIYNPDLNGKREGRWYAKNSPPYLTSTKGFWIKFRSNNDSSRGSGFRALWATATSNSLTGQNGKIASPGWPKHPYTNNADYKWTITVRRGYKVRISFNNFELQREGDNGICNHDFVRIQEGRDGPTLDRKCGLQLPGPVTSKGNVVSIKFHTDDSGTASGFLLTWTATLYDMDSAVKRVPPKNRPSPKGCGKRLFATHKTQPLSHRGQGLCQWVIEVPDGHTISAKFNYLHLRSYWGCAGMMTIYDGNVRGRKLAHIYESWRRNPFPWFSFFRHHWYRHSDWTCRAPRNTLKTKTNYMIIYFWSHYRRGFSLNYKQACGERRTASAGVLHSPGYPKSYAGDLDCLWTITVPADRTIKVTFNSPYSISCGSDYLQLFNGWDERAPALVPKKHSNSRGRYCGTQAPPVVLETGSNVLTVKFLTRRSKSLAGFSFNYTEHHFACGGRLDLTDGITSGYFTSPNYPKLYPRNLDCSWLIITLATHRVQVDFEDSFHIETSDNCERDYLQFYDGGSDNSPNITQPLCGKQLPGSVVSSGKMLSVRFRTDSATVHKGFRAMYSIATCGGRIFGTPSFLTSPNFPGNYGPNLDCFWVIQGPVGHYLSINVTQMNVRCPGDVLKILDPATLSTGTGFSSKKQETSVSYRGISVMQAKAEKSQKQLFKGCGTQRPSKETIDNRAYVLFKSDTSSAASGFKIQVNSSIEECGGDRSTASGSFSSPNYPNLYAHGRVCIWDITVALGRKIKLTFDDNFQLDKIGRTCIHDYVEVRNGLYEESPVLGKFCGEKRPDSVKSTGNTMRVKFITDHAMSSHGFKASYTSDEQADCGGRLTKGPGILASPGFSLSSKQNYGNNLQCVWQIENKAAQNSSIRLELTQFDLQYDQRCSQDFIQVREGGEHSGRLIGKFCGNLKALNTHVPWLISGSPIIVIPTTTAWISFITDKSGSSKGFQLNYTFTDCGGVHSNSPGVIVSPNYPQDYSNNTVCAWLIKAPDGMIIEVSSTSFNLEKQPKCHSDFLLIQNGGHYDSPEIERYCGNTSIGLIKSQSSQLRLVMATDSKGTASGFRLTYTFKQTGCGGMFHKDSGSLTSPNYPASYPDNEQCKWDITVTLGYYVQLKFKPPFDVACNDTVTVYDVINEYYVDTLKTFCINETGELPDLVSSSWNKMRVVFQSDDTTNGNGFSAQYTAECGGSLKEASGTLVSPGYPGYKNNMRCQYTIDYPGNYSIIITFDDFQLQKRPLCSDYLKIYRGYNAKGKQLRSLCGEQDVKQLVVGGPLFLDFKTDGSHTFRGYKAHYEATACGGNFTDSSMQIMSPNYPNAYPAHINCTWTVTVAEKMIIFVKFEDYSIRWTSGCFNAYLKVLDGNSLRAPTIKGLDRICGDKNPHWKTWKTTGNHLLINLVSHNKLGSGKGFKLSYYSSYGPEAGCGKTFTSPSGIFQSLDFDKDGYSDPDLDCTWKITAAKGKIVVLNITNFDVGREGRNCSQAYLKIFDGLHTRPRTLCGKKAAPIIVTSTYRVVFVHFITDDRNDSTGFKASFSQQKPVCGGILFAKKTTQTLSSPQSLEANSRCKWTLHSGHWNKQLKVSVTKLKLGADCHKEYLEILDEPLGNHGQKFNACGTEKPPDFYSMFLKVDIVFQKGSSGDFSLSYQSTGCDRHFKSVSGRVTSPLYDKQTYIQAGCTVDISPPKGSYLSIYFEHFTISGYSKYCHFQFEITSGSFIKRMPCGRNRGIPPPIFLSTNTATIRYKRMRSNYSLIHRFIKFALTFIVSSKGKGCGGDISHAIPGVLSNPPTSKNSDLECTWEINSPKLVRVVVLILSLHKRKAGGNPCAESYLEILDSDGTTLSGKLCKWARLVPVDIKKGKIKYYVARGTPTSKFKLSFRHMDEIY